MQIEIKQLYSNSAITLLISVSKHRSQFRCNEWMNCKPLCFRSHLNGLGNVFQCSVQGKHISVPISLVLLLLLLKFFLVCQFSQLLIDLMVTEKLIEMCQS